MLAVVREIAKMGKFVENYTMGCLHRDSASKSLKLHSREILWTIICDNAISSSGFITVIIQKGLFSTSDVAIGTMLILLQDFQGFWNETNSTVFDG